MSFFGVELNSQNNRLMFEIRLNLSRNKFSPNFRTIYRSLCQYDQQVSGLIHPVHFQKALNANGIFFKKYEWQVFDKCYKKQNQKLSWFDFLSHLKEPMGPARRKLVQDIFDSMDQQKAGKISVQKLLQSFNVSQIQSFKSGKKSIQQVHDQLLSMLAVQDDCITREQFISFYDDMNINFAHNDVFFRFVSVMWNHSIQKKMNATEAEVKAAIKQLRSNLLQRSQGTKDQYLLKKLYSEFDQNNNGCLGSFQFDNLMKSYGCPVPPHVVQPALQKIDRNNSGYIQFEDFKQFVFKDPYPI